MPRNGSGTYSSPAGQPVVTGTVIDSTIFNNNTADVATALTNSIAKNGETTPTANLPMGGFKHTGVADATARTQYTSAAQVQDSLPTYVTGVSGTDTIAGSPTIAVSAYTAGQRFIFLPAATNTGAATINISGLGAKSIVKGSAGAALAAGDLVISVPASIIYNGTSFYLQNPGTNASGVFLAADGAVGAPSYSFVSDPDTGMYRPGGNILGFSTGGVAAVSISTAIVAPFLPIASAAGGGVGTPDFTFNGDTDTGIYHVGADRLGFAAGGAFGFELRNTAGALHIEAVDGSLAAPAYSFSLDPDTGFYRAGANTLVFVVGGTQTLVTTTTQTYLNSGVFNVLDGSAAAPTLGFISDPDTGLFSPGANSLGVSVGGTSQLTINPSAVIVTGAGGTAGVLFLQDKSVSAPSLSFLNDQDSGLYRIGADNLGLSVGNSLVMDWRSAATGGAKVADFGGTLQTVGFRHVPQNAQTANYTLVLADSGKHIYHASGAGAGDTYTIPANASVAYDIGTVLTFVNGDSNAVSIAITSDTMTLAGTTTTGTRTLGQNGVATAVKTTATTWIISGPGLT